MKNKNISENKSSNSSKLDAANSVFFRYEIVEYASIDYDGEYTNLSSFPNPKVELRKYNLWKETPKGYWIGYGTPDTLRGRGKWISKTGKKRFAYPTKKEALNNFIMRNERRVKILSSQLESCKISINIAKKMFIENL